MTNQEFFAQTLAGEFAKFRSVLAALPADKIDYRHDEVSRSARQLVSHLIGHFQDIVEAIDDGAVHHRNQVPFTDMADALAIYDASVAELQSRLSGVSDETWARVGGFFIGEHEAMQAPCQALVWMLFLDAVHHRGQLSTLIRPMGGKVPAIYGPSADTARAS